MAFIILGSVGSAIGAGLTAAGLGTIGGAVTAGAGALSGIGSGIAGGIGSALMAAGVPGSVGAGGAVGGAAGTIGTAATTAAGGAGLGAATSAATGGDPGQGALFGALGGAVTGGLGALGGAGGGAGSAAGTTASEAILNPTAQAAAPGALTVGDVATETAMNQVGNAVAPGLGGVESSVTPAASSPMFGELGSDLMKEGAQQGMDMMKPEDKQARPPERIAAGRPRSPYSFGGDKDSPLSNPFAHFAEGGLTTLKGGGIAMRDGQYVIPADVVSAIGNGSSKAGAKFLEAAFNHYIQNGPPEGLQAPQRAGSLAEQRAIERMNRKPV